MRYTHLHSVTIVVSLSLFMSLISCHRAGGRSINVPEASELISMLMFDSNLSGTRNSDQSSLPELIPEELPNYDPPSEENDYIYSQEYSDMDSADPGRIFPVINYNEDTIKPTLIKRGCHSSRHCPSKKSSLSDLIKRLMALKGNSFPDGRITLMRFGTGRRK